MKVVFFLRRIGPYHHARFEATVGSIDLVAVETRPMSSEYPWVFSPKTSYTNIKFPRGTNPETGIRGNLLSKTIDTILDSEKPSVVVTTGWADAEYHAIVLASRKRKIPLVVVSDSRYEDEARRFHKELVKRFLLKSYSGALVAGKASRRYLERLGMHPKAIFQPWDVVENNHFQKTTEKIDFKDRSFLCVARFIEKKNIAGLVNAYNIYVNDGGQRNLRLVGSGALESQVRNQVSHLGLSEKVSFTDFVQYDALPDIFHSGFFLILPSFTDQWGLVVNEAMAAGLPVAVSNQCGCASDLVHDLNNGFIFDPFSVNKMADTLKKCDINEGQWNRMSSISRDIIGRWTVTDFAKGLNDACNYAITHPSSLSFKFLHRLLSV
jgi:glycosyltransferase involved in cell wall biosynthesis